MNITVHQQLLRESEGERHEERVRIAEIGMQWWNSCSEAERGYWLKRANSAVPADAYEAFRTAPLRSYRVKYLGVRGSFHFADIKAINAEAAVRSFMRSHPGIAMAQCIGVSP